MGAGLAPASPQQGADPPSPGCVSKDQAERTSQYSSVVASGATRAPSWRSLRRDGWQIFTGAEGRLLFLRAGKSHRERTLPLEEQIGQALVEYLQRRRPRALHRRVFLQCHAPYGPLTNVAISHIARRALQRAGIAVTHPGAHVFRHTVATEMVRGGASFPQVADVLGHESLQTTAIYAKLDLDSLSQLALPWPGGEQ